MNRINRFNYKIWGIANVAQAPADQGILGGSDIALLNAARIFSCRE
jgi:hypothetical protein